MEGNRLVIGLDYGTTYTGKFIQNATAPADKELT